MPENDDQAAVVQELFNRRESLDPERRAVVDELAKRFNVSAPHDKNELPGYKEAEAWHEAESKKPPQSASQTLWDAAKQLGSAAISPITGIRGAVKGVYDWAAGGFHAPAVQPNGRLGPPDYATQANPVTESAAMLSGSALLPAAAEGAVRGGRAVANTARAAGKAVSVPGNLGIAAGSLEAAAGAGLLTHEPAFASYLIARGGSKVAKSLAERRAHLDPIRAAEQTARMAAEHRAGPQPTPAWRNFPEEAPTPEPAPAEAALTPREWFERNRALRKADPRNQPVTEQNPATIISGPSLNELNDISVALGGKRFKTMQEVSQPVLDSYAAMQRNGAPPAEATPAPTPGRFSSEEFRSARPAPAAPAEQPIQTAESAPSPAAAPTAAEAAKALYDALQETGDVQTPAQSATAVGETMHQLNRTGAASNIAQSLHKNGISAAQFQRLRKLNMPMLEELAKRLRHDLSDPSSWEQVGTELKKLSSKKAAAVSQ